ncbi:response regulator transcription factor [Leifsonia poae]|uniref:DNA-binding response regulator n=1 Tax=Leifsonia poae TaxID=110933 RepID=A0A9W6LZQ7_9MICO|nr:DNA-binding response regulator [Leifsonia poae]
MVEDHALMRSLVADGIGSRGFEVAAFGRAADALDALESFDPDLLVTDIDLGERPNGVELAGIVRSRAPHVAVVFLTNLSREAASATARELIAGASFVNKGAIESIDELVDAAEAALDDRPYAREVPLRAPQTSLAGLSSTQLATVRLLAAGLTNAEIARRRGVSVRAVEKSVERIFAALQLSDDGVAPRVATAAAYIATFGDPATGLG